jgi:hypothetical protein
MRDNAGQTGRAQGLLRRNMAINSLFTLPPRCGELFIAQQWNGKLIGTLR